MVSGHTSGLGLSMQVQEPRVRDVRARPSFLPGEPVHFGAIARRMSSWYPDIHHLVIRRPKRSCLRSSGP